MFNYLQHNARLYGGEAGFHLHPHPLDWLHIEASYSSAFGQDDAANYLALMPSQKIKAMIGASFSFDEVKKQRAVSLQKLSVYLQDYYSFTQNRLADNEIFTPDYNLLNAGFTFEFGIKSQPVQLNILVNNILNDTYYDHLSRYKAAGIFNMGRSFHVKLSVPLLCKIN